MTAESVVHRDVLEDGEDALRLEFGAQLVRHNAETEQLAEEPGHTR